MKIDPLNDNVDFYLLLAKQLSRLSDLICNKPQAGYMPFGQICNFHRVAIPSDI